MRLAATVLQCADPIALATFYQRLLGWEWVSREATWAQLRSPDYDRPRLSFQREPGYQAPVWPCAGDGQTMQAHLDLEVEDLDAAEQRAVAAGATRADRQLAQDVRIMIDPAGHPFCFFLPGA